MENSIDNTPLVEEEENVGLDADMNSEEYTPKLFSDDGYSKVETNLDNNHETHSEKLFEQYANDAEDFEIPAFLRKQKF